MTPEMCASHRGKFWSLWGEYHCSVCLCRTYKLIHDQSLSESPSLSSDCNFCTIYTTPGHGTTNIWFSLKAELFVAIIRPSITTNKLQDPWDVGRATHGNNHPDPAWLLDTVFEIHCAEPFGLRQGDETAALPFNMSEIAIRRCTAGTGGTKFDKCSQIIVYADYVTWLL